MSDFLKNSLASLYTLWCIEGLKGVTYLAPTMALLEQSGCDPVWKLLAVNPLHYMIAKPVQWTVMESKPVPHDTV